jgi:glutamyl-tRNA synthetase
MFPVRVALSGKSGGPDLGDILGLLGREKCAARLKAFSESM